MLTGPEQEKFTESLALGTGGQVEWEGLSRTSTLTRLLDHAQTALAMLGDVLSFLDSHSVAARTTNVITTLPGICDLAPQQRALALAWSEFEQDSVPSLEEAWSAAKDGFRALIEAATPVRDGEPVYPYARYQGWRSPLELTHDAKVAEDLRKHFEYLKASLPAHTALEWVKEIQSDVEALEEEVFAVGEEIERSGSTPYEKHALLDNEIQQIERFIEQLADEVGAEVTADEAALLESRIFRHLPQLYEVWVLCTLLGAAERAGHKVQLLDIDYDSSGDVWGLKFARAKDPVATIAGLAVVFFQLEERNQKSMPDIALWADATRSGDALAVFDPKFSEKGGYGAADYKRTAERYCEVFGGETKILEYHDRPDLKDLGEALLTGVRPGGGGKAMFEACVFAAIARACPVPGIAVVDVSRSCQAMLPWTSQLLRRLAGQSLVQNRYFTFSEMAAAHDNMADDLGRGDLRVRLGAETRLEPLLTLLKEEVEPGVQLLLLSDGEFADADDVQPLVNSGYNVWRVAPGIP